MHTCARCHYGSAALALDFQKYRSQTFEVFVDAFRLGRRKLFVAQKLSLAVSERLFELRDEVAGAFAAAVLEELLVVQNEVEVRRDVLRFQLLAGLADQVTLWTFIEGADISYRLVVLRAENFAGHLTLYNDGGNFVSNKWLVFALQRPHAKGPFPVSTKLNVELNLE